MGRRKGEWISSVKTLRNFVTSSISNKNIAHFQKNSKIKNGASVHSGVWKMPSSK